MEFAFIFGNQYMRIWKALRNYTMRTRAGGNSRMGISRDCFASLAMTRNKTLSLRGPVGDESISARANRAGKLLSNSRFTWRTAAGDTADSVRNMDALGIFQQAIILAIVDVLVAWRRERDSNPRIFRSTVFKTAALNHSAIPPVRRFKC